MPHASRRHAQVRLYGALAARRPMHSRPGCFGRGLRSRVEMGHGPQFRPGHSTGRLSSEAGPPGRIRPAALDLFKIRFQFPIEFKQVQNFKFRIKFTRSAKFMKPISLFIQIQDLAKKI
jgi:hypothetical protein